MKTIKYFSILIASMLLIASCSDFLDFRPEGTTTAGAVDYTNPDNIFLSVSAAYATLRSDDVHGFSYIGLFEIASDNADKGSTPDDSPTMKKIDNLSFTSTNSLINTTWTGFYNVVSAANYAIGQMSQFIDSLSLESDREYARQCQAEARFIRAYAYFDLVRVFGRIPLIDTTMTSEQLASVPQSSEADIYKFIDNDLDDAIANMPASYSSKSWAGRATKYSAMALKAKVDMYQQKWDTVAALTDKIIASGQYGLLDDFRSVFSVNEENSKESLFEIQSSTFGNESGDKTYCDYGYFQGPRGNTPGNMQGWGFCTPSNNLIAFFASRGDSIRAKATFLYRGTITPEGDSIKTACTNPVYNGKVYTPSSYNNWNYNGYAFDHNPRILRYSEVLLMFAEAYAQGATYPATCGLSGYDALNMVRARAGLLPETLTIQNVWDERRAELAMEEDRYFDLIRTGQAHDAMSAVGKNFVVGKNEHYPIPSNQLQTNTNLTQNSGY